MRILTSQEAQDSINEQPRTEDGRFLGVNTNSSVMAAVDKGMK